MPRSSSFRVTVTSALMLLISGCDQSPKNQFVAPPVEAIQSFEAFVDTYRTTMEEAVRAAGYHLGWDNLSGSAENALQIHVSALREDYAPAQLFEARLLVSVHDFRFGSDGPAIPMFVSLHFVRQGVGEGWGLLMQDGAPFELIPPDEGARSRQRSLASSLAQTFPSRVDFIAWWTYRCEQLLSGGFITEPEERERCETLTRG